MNKVSRVREKPWTLNTALYDDSDPNARTRISEILKIRKIGSIYKDLPTSKYLRDRRTGEVIGIRLKTQVAEAVVEPQHSEIQDDVGAVNDAIYSENDELPDDILEQHSMPVRGPGRPKKPIDLVQTLHEELQRSRQTNDTIANCFESLMPLAEKNKVKARIQPWFKKKIWLKNYGADVFSAKCPVCSISTITMDSFSAGHCKPESKGGPIAIDNMMAICDECNSQMGTHHLYWFAWRYYARALWPFPQV